MGISSSDTVYSGPIIRLHNGVTNTKTDPIGCVKVSRLLFPFGGWPKVKGKGRRCGCHFALTKSDFAWVLILADCGCADTL